MMDDDRGFVGKTVLIGLTNYDHSGELLGYQQLFGEIKTLSAERGIEVELDDGGKYYLPPDTSVLSEAPPGEYRLRETGKIIINPDFICTYSVTKPPLN